MLAAGPADARPLPWVHPMRRAALVFVLVFAPFAVAAAGARWRAGPVGGASRLADGTPDGPPPPVLHGFTPADYARFVAAYPERWGGRAAAVDLIVRRYGTHGRPLDAYRLALDDAAAAHAFRALAADCFRLAGGLTPRPTEDYRLGQLRELVDAHAGRADPADPLVPFYRAYLLFRAGHYADAEGVMAAAFGPDSRGPGLDPDLTLGLRAAVWAEWRRWGEPGGPPPPLGVTWDAVFWHLRAVGRAADADRALALWAGTVPADDPAVAWARMHAAADRNDYAGCLAAADHCLAADAVAVHRPTARQYRVFALAHLGRFADADRELEELDSSGQFLDADKLELLVALLSGDAARVDRLVEPYGSLDRLLAHPRLGPLLRADRWADLRRKYPPADRP